MSKLSLWRTRFLLCVFCVLGAIGSPAQTFTTLVSFNGTDGSDPEYGPLVQGTDGNFYGTTGEGGATYGGAVGGNGTVFKITPTGTLTTLYNFCSQPYCTDGSIPWAGLVLATDGNFYGTTAQGGANGWGTVFKITPTGTLTTLYSFCAQPNCTDGASPNFGLVQATNGNFYGATQAAPVFGNSGTVFEITPTGTLTTLHTFDGTTDGASPGTLVQATDGNLYGTTGGGYGTVFKITPQYPYTLTTLHTFDITDGSGPVGPLVQATDGNFYGTTIQGGANNSCSYGCGTVFKITPQYPYTLTTLHSFDGTDGSYPIAGLVQATDENLYGTTEEGGGSSACSTFGCGTVFEITPGGTLTTLHTFEGPPDGSFPAATLLQATNGNLYGTSIWGGTSNTCATGPNSSVGCGTVFSLSVGLPFIPPSQVATTASGLAYSRVTQTFNGTVTLKNIGTSAITGPFQIFFYGMPARVTLVNATGSLAGIAYLTVSAVTSLAPGQSVTVSVQFKNPSNTKITFTPQIYSGSIP